MAALLLCQRIGCSARYSEDSNEAESCRFHSAAPVFHDGTKEWPCCGKRSHDFTLFMDIPGCARGRHTQEKPVKPAAAATPPSLAPLKLATAATQPVDRAECARCRQGFFCSDHPAAAVDPAPAAPPPPPPPPPVDPDVEQTCRNAGCGSRFRERDNTDEACAFHPGPPIFHERAKGWKCCGKQSHDFDDFLNIPPCTKGRHCAAPAASRGPSSS